MTQIYDINAYTLYFFVIKNNHKVSGLKIRSCKIIDEWDGPDRIPEKLSQAKYQMAKKVGAEYQQIICILSIVILPALNQDLPKRMPWKNIRIMDMDLLYFPSYRQKYCFGLRPQTADTNNQIILSRG